MIFHTRPPRLPQVKASLLGLGVSKGSLATPLGREIDRRLGGLITNVLKREELKGKAGEMRLLETHGKIPAANILLIGLGDPQKTDAEILRKAAAKLVRTGDRLHVSSVMIEDPAGSGGATGSAWKKIPSDLRGAGLAEGAVLGHYRFNLYKSSENHAKTVREFLVLTSEETAIGRGLGRGKIFGEATNFARDLVNIPASDMTPRRMALEARKIGRLPRLTARIFDRKGIERMGMGCYLAVARGSTEPPYFLHLHYRPAGKIQKKIALIGKGVTFDSGGLSLKGAQSMETMKDDMSGAAAMLAVMKALPLLKVPVEVHGISAVTENMPGGSAGKPGDIARSMSGKTVEILNTDAEGRLTLADAITYALRQKPNAAIDVATLTGACVIALGDLCSGILGNNQKLIDDLIASGRREGERIWQLPLVDEYREELKSNVADLKNVGGKWGGTINGALFIGEFTDPKVPWAQIDIAGPSWTEKDSDECPKGGTGHIVRTLLDFLSRY